MFPMDSFTVVVIGIVCLKKSRENLDGKCKGGRGTIYFIWIPNSSLIIQIELSLSFESVLETFLYK